jgi:hypothetical protein
VERQIAASTERALAALGPADIEPEAADALGELAVAATTRRG